MIKGYELIERMYSQNDSSLVEADKSEEDMGVKNYNNGSIQVIYNGRRPINNNFKETLGEDLLNALDELFKNCKPMPLMIDVIFNIREK